MDQGPGLNIFDLVEFLKKKGCAEHEIDEYFRKAISANTAQLQITDCEFSSDLFHRVYDKLDALVHEENIVDELGFKVPHVFRTIVIIVRSE